MIKVYTINFNGVLTGAIQALETAGMLTTNYHEATHFLFWQDVRGDCLELARIVKNHLNKPLLVMQHGRGATRDYGPPNNFRLLADKILVWGESEKERLLRYGIVAERIEVVGCPLFQFLRPKESRIGINVLFVPIISSKEEPENLLVYAELKKWEMDKLVGRINRDFEKLKKGWAFQDNQIRRITLPNGTTEERLWSSDIRPGLPRNISHIDGLVNAKLTTIHDAPQYQCPLIISDQGNPNGIKYTCELLSNIDVLVCLEEGTMQLLAAALNIPVIVVDIFNYRNYGGVENYDQVEKIKTDSSYWITSAGKIGQAIDFALAHKDDKVQKRIAVCEREGGAHLGNSNKNIVRAIESLADIAAPV